MVHLVKLSLLSFAVAPLALTVAVQGQSGQAKQTTGQTKQTTGQAKQTTGQAKQTTSADLNPAPNLATSVLLTSDDSPSNCPIAVRAQMRSGGGVLSAGTPRSSDRASIAGQIAQHIRVILDPSILTKAQDNSESGSNRRLLRAKVTVNGTNGTWRIVNSSTATAEPALPRSPFIEKTLEINLIPVATSDKGDSVYADLELPGFTSVKSIRLDSVAYADGSSWTPVSGRACRIAPDPLMLVSTR